MFILPNPDHISISYFITPEDKLCPSFTANTLRFGDVSVTWNERPGNVSSYQRYFHNTVCPAIAGVRF